MKRLSKILALVMCAVLAIGVFASCGDDKGSVSGDTLTYWTPIYVTIAETQTSYGDMLMYKEMSKATGINVDFIHPAQGSTGSEAFQILLSSGDYPDMIEYGWTKYSGGPDQAIADGVIISLNDYMKDYAPNYYDYMEGEKGKANGNLYKAQSVTIEGNYFGFRNMNIGTYRGFQGLYVRKDKLNEWGLDVPVTIDDWTKLFKTAKENGVKYPFTAISNSFSFTGVDSFNTAWNVGKAYYVDGETVKFGPFEKEYKDFITKMAEWCKAGYIDIDYITNDNVAVEGAMTNGSSIASLGYVGGALGKLLPAMKDRDPKYDLVACPYPVMKAGDKPLFGDLQPESADSTIAITVECGKDNKDRYKDAIKWCDYLYSEEGNILKCFGVEGDTFTIEKGEDGKEHYVYTDRIFDFEKVGANSIDGALAHFMRPASAPGLNQHTDYLMGMYAWEQQREALDTWNLYVDDVKKHEMPPVFYTTEEASEKSIIESNAKDNLDAALHNIILGKADISTYDAAIKKAKDAGYGKLLEIQQTAYDRYLKALK